ncbi:unnamed protein product [marine sediment metagenome]|uniref:Uncharacterized protein n=1 Tax=marine sediment metagenome TaxID=412755 RepID=X1PN23_9ZZZZ
MKPNWIILHAMPDLREVDLNLLGPDGNHVFDPTVYWHYVNVLGFKCDAAPVYYP